MLNTLLSIVLSSVSGVATLMAADDVMPNANHQVWVSGEMGPVWQSRNDVRIPAASGSNVDLTAFGKGPKFYGRMNLGYTLFQNHELRALYAPLSLKFTGKASQNFSYQGQTFAAGVPIDALYRFNSYRLTYRYYFWRDGRWDIGAGATAKIRDADISMTQGGVTASRSNVGFVPLLHLVADYEWFPALHFQFDVDALAAPQGRAEDLMLSVDYVYSPKLTFRTGYRMVEGGSDGTTGGVYTFAWLHYWAFGMQYHLF